MVAGPCGKDPEFKRVGQNSSRKCTVNLAVGKRDVSGQDRAETIWCNVVAWHGLSEVLADAQKGDPVFVIGRLQSREWKGKTYTDLVAEFVSVCAVDSRPAARRAGPAPSAAPPITDLESLFREFTTPEDKLPF